MLTNLSFVLSQIVIRDSGHADPTKRFDTDGAGRNVRFSWRYYRFPRRRRVVDCYRFGSYLQKNSLREASTSLLRRLTATIVGVVRGRLGPGLHIRRSPWDRRADSTNAVSQDVEPVAQSGCGRRWPHFGRQQSSRSDVV